MHRAYVPAIMRGWTTGVENWVKHVRRRPSNVADSIKCEDVCHTFLPNLFFTKVQLPAILDVYMEKGSLYLDNGHD